jgi:hypothetical protein
MNTKLITFSSSLLAVGALALAYGAGCGDDGATGTPVYTATPTNTAATNTAATNTAATNTAATNTAATNTPATATAATNTVAQPGGYLDTGVLHGYCFGLYKVGTVETKCDVEAALTCDYTLPGTSWDDIAMIGCNVNQPVEGGDGSEGTLVPTFTSICIQGTGFERIQIQGPNGATDAEDRWCAVPDATGCAALSSFNTKCWDNSGSTYASQPLEQVAALQPSKSDGVDVAVNPLSGTIVISSISTQ